MKKNTLILLILTVLAVQRIYSQNAPVTAAGNIVSVGTTAIVPITATATTATGVASIALKLNYDPSVVTAVIVTKAPGLTGTLSYGVSNPGIITIGWFQSSNMIITGTKLLFNIQFSKVSYNTSPVTFINSGYTCEYSDEDGIVLNDMPTATYYLNGSLFFQDAPKTSASVSSSCPGTIVSVPVIVNNFKMIKAVSLTLKYTASVLTYASSSANDAFGLTIDGSTPGTIIIGGFEDPAVTLANGSTLLTLNFTYNGGSTGLTWYDDGGSCEFANVNGSVLNDSPQSVYYFNGSVIPSPTQWTGTESSNWESIGNWSCDFPTATTDVTINTTVNNPEISSAVTVKSLTINAGAKVTINPNGRLTVTNTLANNAGNDGLLIKSNAAGTGSLLHYSNDVPATIERYITGSTDLSIYKYHFVAIPLLQTENPTSNLFLGSYLFSFTEGTNQWLGLGSATATNLSIDKGYMIYYPNTSITYNFAGKMNNGPLSITIPYSGSAPGSNTAGFNLVPNPYPSAIDWLATDGWFKFNIDDAIYIWPATGSASSLNYASFVDEIGLHGGSQYIAQGQSFFIHANNTGAGFQIKNPSRQHNSVAFFKEDKIIPNVLRIKTIANEATDEMVVRFKSEATTGFDGNYDAYKMVGGADAPQLNTVASDNSKLCINALPFNENETIVPMNFSFSSATNVTFTASGMETFTLNSPIYLEDMLNGAMINLRDNPVYTFSYEPGSDENRFKLHFAKVVGIGEGQEPTDGTVYISGGELYIDVPSMNGQKTEIRVYNMLGQQLDLNRVTMNGMTNMPFSLPTGVYIVRVTSAAQVFAGKLVNN